MANNRKEIYGVLTTKDTIPLSTSTSGLTLATTSGKSSFTMSTTNDNFIKGAWIWDTTNDELYKVDRMTSTTTGNIVGTFNDTEATMATAIIKEADAMAIQLGVVAKADTTINGVDLASGDALNFSVTGIGGDVGSRYVDPVIADGATGEVRYIITKY